MKPLWHNSHLEGFPDLTGEWERSKPPVRCNHRPVASLGVGTAPQKSTALPVSGGTREEGQGNHNISGVKGTGKPLNYFALHIALFHNLRWLRLQVATAAQSVLSE